MVFVDALLRNEGLDMSRVWMVGTGGVAIVSLEDLNAENNENDERLDWVTTGGAGSDVTGVGARVMPVVPATAAAAKDSAEPEATDP